VQKHFVATKNKNKKKWSTIKKLDFKKYGAQYKRNPELKLEPGF